jgi:cation diffusion facilitator family transporter
LGGSQALVADGVHSLSDFATDGAILLGSKFWSKEPDKQHPYGHGRIETMITVGIAVVLCAAAAGIAIEAVMTFAEASERPPGILVMVVALFSVAIKEFLYRITRKTGERLNSSALIANAWHHRTDAISSIPVFVAALVVRFFPQYYFLDNIAAIIVAVLLIKAAWDIVKPSLSELMEAQIHGDIVETLNKLENKYPEVYEFHKIRVRSVGGAHFAELHMLTDGSITVKKAHDITDKIKTDLLKEHNNLYDVTIHVEPK